jgi:hypothetical protein
MAIRAPLKNFNFAKKAPAQCGKLKHHGRGPISEMTSIQFPDLASLVIAVKDTDNKIDSNCTVKPCTFYNDRHKTRDYFTPNFEDLGWVNLLQ